MFNYNKSEKIKRLSEYKRKKEKLHNMFKADVLPRHERANLKTNRKK